MKVIKTMESSIVTIECENWRDRERLISFLEARGILRKGRTGINGTNFRHVTITDATPGLAGELEMLAIEKEIKKTIRYHIAEKIVFLAVLFGNESLRDWLLKDLEDNPKRYLRVKR